MNQVTSPLLQVQDIGFSYPSKRALDNVSFNLERGAFHALLGPNGAGKSTLFALISRLFKLQDGDILLDGVSLRRSPAAVLGRIGMVFQQSSLDLDLSVAENLHYHAALHGIGRTERKNRIEEELRRVDMLDALDRKVRALNGGHRRRVEIARALLHHPDLLLLDEATVGLDPRARIEINQHVRSLCVQQGVTVLWSTHLIEEIHNDDPVTLLHQSRLLANGSARQLCELAGTDDLVTAFHSLTGKKGAAA